MSKLLPALCLCLALTGCPQAQFANPTGAGTPSPKGPTTGDETIKGGNVASVRQGLEGAILGFSGEEPRFKAADADNMSVVPQNERGQQVADVKSVKPTPNGSFLIRDMVPGPYFVQVTLPDKTTYMALMRTDRGNENRIGPGSTLATVWAKEQLATKLVFIEDLAYTALAQAAIRFDRVLASKELSLRDDDAERFKQVGELLELDAELKEALRLEDERLTARAAQNLAAPPAYASKSEYDAKKARLKL